MAQKGISVDTNRTNRCGDGEEGEKSDDASKGQASS
jgi:hypothetical protein